MREIKFRAYDKDEKNMIYTDDYSGTYSFDFDYDKSLKCCSNNPYCDPFGDEHDDWKVLDNIMQYTGLKDKNGKEIYEGDIFKFNDEVWTSSYTSCGTEYDSCNAENYGVVGFAEDTLRFDFVKYKYNENQVEADLHENHDLEFADFIQEHEVIGNIYENPELLN